MFKTISIKGVNSYFRNELRLEGLEELNFIYGHNGTGKTTVAQVIEAKTETGPVEPAGEDSNDYSNCESEQTSTKLKAHVYNRDFINRNFSQDEVDGIATVLAGENAQEIKRLEEEKSQLEKELDGEKGKNGLNQDKEGAEKEAKSLKEGLIKCCGEERVKLEKIDGIFEEALGSKHGLEGLRGKNETLAEALGLIKDKETCPLEARDSKEEPLSLEKLKEKCKVFSGDFKKYDSISMPSFEVLRDPENKKNGILEKAIQGKEGTSLSEMIERLKNSAWVSAGRPYFKQNKCPFCQQDTPQEFAQKLEDYFNKDYEEAIGKIKAAESNYETGIEQLTKGLNLIAGNGFLKFEGPLEDFKDGIRALEKKIGEHKKSFEEKLRKPNLRREFKVPTREIEALETMIEEAIKKIKTHNENFEDKKGKQEKAREAVLNYLRNELKESHQKYSKEAGSKKMEIGELDKEIGESKEKIKEQEDRIQALQEASSGIVKMMGKINKHLEKAGFVNFKLEPKEKGEEKKGRYAINRGGKFHSLSEGELSFLAFLYFYHQLPLEDAELENKEACMVVFDDPVSSMDEATLFYTVTLIQNIIKEVKKESASSIKQIFILTHNVFFHKKVAWNQGGDFWILSKGKEGPSIQSFKKKNPIKTLNDSLWIDFARMLCSVKGEDRACAPQSWPNTLRRLLEHFAEEVLCKEFHKLGKACEDCEDCKLGKDCKSRLKETAHLAFIKQLNSYSHDGGGACMPFEEKDEEHFKGIFEELGYEQYYKRHRDAAKGKLES